MKVYVAGPWMRKAEVIAFAKQLRKVGHEVTSRWFDHVGDPNDPTGATVPLEEIQFQARQDLEDVRRADVLIVLNLEKSEGKAAETGYAIAFGIPIISVGKRSNIFQALGRELDTTEEAIAALASMVHLAVTPTI